MTFQAFKNESRHSYPKTSRKTWQNTLKKVQYCLNRVKSVKSMETVKFMLSFSFISELEFVLFLAEKMAIFLIQLVEKLMQIESWVLLGMLCKKRVQTLKMSKISFMLNSLYFCQFSRPQNKHMPYKMNFKNWHNFHNLTKKQGLFKRKK